jgi:hypothetical protein
MSAVLDTIDLEVTDVSDQHRFTAEAIPRDASISELARVLAKDMALPDTDPRGRPQVYGLLHERTGRTLNSSETLTEAGIEPNDKVVLTPSIEAGS